MKKIRSLLPAILLLAGLWSKGFAQDKSWVFGEHFIFHTSTSTSYYSTDDKNLSMAVGYLNQQKAAQTAILKGRYEIGLFTKLSPTLTNFTGAPVTAINKTYTSYIISDSSEAVLVAMGINKDNIQDYRYHVVKNDSIEIVPWSPISKLEQKYGAHEPYGAIGTFKEPGGTILVEVVNTKNYKIRDGIIYDWRASFKPYIESLIVNTPSNFFELKDPKENRGYAKKVDHATGSPLDVVFPQDSVNQMSLHFRRHETIPYTIYIEKLDGDSAGYKQIAYYLLDDRFTVKEEFIKKPGKYRLKVIRVGYEDNQVLYIPFEVKPPPVTDKKVSLKQALPYLIATLSGVALLFYIYYRRNQRKLNASTREKQLARLKLKSIRSQLNPHFMFNALTSIQNLINKNKIESANYYLSIFSGLTRQVLDTGNEEMLSIQDELKILDDYLQMEQLRFGFNYQINADEHLNQANIEIPAMLLQPFVENAVKHGVSGLKESGNVVINIAQEDNDLVLSVQDNGHGFIKNNNFMGYGMKLSEERVLLLNQIYKGQSVTLTVDSSNTGTIINIRLTNWIS
ncbi:periplasmic sensor signal transduction histidine kinase [Pedobacter sp. BAL39]|uniref:sensor histidine kinase n=1 Tax=Pedobacter sp. BAL39 TaxID=391596 RepID=UPI0001559814|nr:histidine kinase [Pedobacter sp. BAL39]EDM36944.1 periplasmic sensor signal transduction histidine kinase [Pedobacter sp. BAL39]